MTEIYLDLQFALAKKRVAAAIDTAAAAARASIQAQAESARRSIGQRVRYAKTTGEKA